MKTKKLFIIIALLGMFSLSFSQTPPDTLWTKTFGGIDDEYCRCVIQTSDGGFALAGYTQSFGAGEEDMYLVKINASGDTLWTRTYGGSSSDGCNSLIQTNDNGFLLAGWSNGAENIGYLVKTDSFGNMLWTLSFDGIIFLPDLLYGGLTSVIADFDGSFSTLGTYIHSDTLFIPYLVKINVSGDTLWTRKCNYGYSIWCPDHINTSDNGYALAGKVFGENDNDDAYLIRTDINGDTLWTQVYQEDKDINLWSIIETPDEGFCLVGDIENEDINNNYYFWQIHTDNYGNQLWSFHYGDANSLCRNHIRTDDGGYLLSGSVNYNNQDFWVLKTNSNGDSLWSVSYGGSSDENCFSAIQTSDLGFVYAGVTESFGAGGLDFWMVRTEPDPVGIDDYLNSIPKAISLSQNYPNPFNPETTITFYLPKKCNVDISVYNVKGQKIRTLAIDIFDKGNHDVIWNGIDNFGNKVSSGVYYFELNVNGKTEFVRKCLLLK